MQEFAIKNYIQPFERDLALQELRAVAGTEVFPKGGDDRGASIFLAGNPQGMAATKLAYWERAGPDNQPTLQVRREATLGIARNGVPIEDIPNLTFEEVAARIPRKRCLRYGTHGLHEYRGKFFPQLVKSLINISGVSRGALVVDPMCGSGTTVVEAVLSGLRGRGVDMNPLSVMIARVKAESLKATPAEVISALSELQSALATHQIPRARTRPEKDAAYLSSWFGSGVLEELDGVCAEIDKLNEVGLRDFYRVCLSNVLRSVSFQREADLRVRREEKTVLPGQATQAFLQEATRSSRSLVAFLAHGSLHEVGQAVVTSGDARSFCRDGHVEKGSADLVITSPPYATALPYLDTDRLSLIYLDLLSRADHRSHDRLMIGNREVTERARQTLWLEYEQKRGLLPRSVTDLVDHVEESNSRANVGFRRKNLGALLGKYFCDMQSVLTETNEALKPGSSAYFVVGNNRTTLPDGEIEIRTASLLLDIAVHLGFDECTSSPMEMLSSRDIFSKNQTPSEHILKMSRQK